MFRSLFILALAGLSLAAELQHSRQEEYPKADLNDVHFLLWTRSNSGDADSYELYLDDAATLGGSNFDSSKPTHIVAHGWNANGHSGWPVEAKTELLSYYDCNVISIDWGEIAGNVNYFAVVGDLPQVGQHAANFVDFLHNEGGLDITSLHVTGHSLGAHLSGFLGSGVVNGPVGRITGLDPAAPEYYEATASERLGKEDATFVEIIHSNACNLLDFCVGLVKEIGHVDYYPNGGDHQPGCTIGGDWMELLTGGCSHGRSHEYWVESINGATPFTARPCADWASYDAGLCPDCGQGCLDMGLHADTSLRGTYFLETRALSPYAKG